MKSNDNNKVLDILASLIYLIILILSIYNNKELVFSEYYKYIRFGLIVIYLISIYRLSNINKEKINTDIIVIQFVFVFVLHIILSFVQGYFYTVSFASSHRDPFSLIFFILGGFFLYGASELVKCLFFYLAFCYVPLVLYLLPYFFNKFNKIFMNKIFLAIFYLVLLVFILQPNIIGIIKNTVENEANKVEIVVEKYDEILTEVIEFIPEGRSEEKYKVTIMAIGYDRYNALPLEQKWDKKFNTIQI